jgi:hypothetical protein
LHHAVPWLKGFKLGSVNIDGKGHKGDLGKRGWASRYLGNFFIDSIQPNEDIQNCKSENVIDDKLNRLWKRDVI